MATSVPFLNFLTQGQPQPSTTSTLTTTQVPQYLSDYLYNLMSGAYSAAQEEYQPYSGPRIAGFTQPQQEAFDVTKNMAMAYQPQLQAAQQTAAKGAGLDTLATAQPYFAQAGQTLPSTIQNYMNPYNQNVIQTMGSEAQRQLQEKILPQISDQFTRSGQYGSTRHQEIAQRGARDIASDLEANIGKQLAQGYTTAGTQAQNDLTRLASIGQAAGQLAGTQEQQSANLANIQAGLGQKAQALGLSGAAALEATGSQQQAMNQRNLDLAYQDFLKQTEYPKEQIGFLSNVIRGLPAGGSTQSQNQVSSGQTYSASPLASIATGLSGAASLGNLLKTV
jgi:hypothetical protein